MKDDEELADEIIPAEADVHMYKIENNLEEIFLQKQPKKEFDQS